MSDPKHIVVCDDEAGIRDIVAKYLTAQGFKVSKAGDGTALRQLLAAGTVDLVLIDLGLPGEDGLSITRDIRAHSNVGLIIITGRIDPVDRVVGLELGADDYVGKPLDLRELLARIRTVLRRAGQAGPAGTDAAVERYRFAGWALDASARTLTAADGRDIPLTTGEFDLLRCFAQHPNRVLSRDQLLQSTRHREATAYDRAVDMQVIRLRRKIEADPENPSLIKSVRGAGYIFATPVERG